MTISADTPRVSKMLISLGFPDSTSRFAELARQLERELNQALTELEARSAIPLESTASRQSEPHSAQVS